MIRKPLGQMKSIGDTHPDTTGSAQLGIGLKSIPHAFQIIGSKPVIIVAKDEEIASGGGYPGIPGVDQTRCRSNDDAKVDVISCPCPSCDFHGIISTPIIHDQNLPT